VGGINIMKHQAKLFNLQRHLDDIFAHARDIAEFMQDIRDAHGGNRGPIQRREQYAAKGIPQGYPIAPFEGADNKLTIVASFCSTLNLRRYHIA